MPDENVNRQFGTVLSESDMTGPATTLRDIGASQELAFAGAPDVSRAAARELYKVRVARLGEELEHMTRLLSWARECLETEMFSGLGYKKLGISDKDLQKIASLSTSLEKAISAKIRYDKSSKDMADSMTPEEEFQSVVSYVRTLEMPAVQKLTAVLAEYRGRLRADLLKRGLSGPEAE